MNSRIAPVPGAQTVARAIAVLKTFTDDQPHLTLAEVSRAVKLNRVTAYRLLSALETEGLVARDQAAETYRLGPEAIALGGRALRANDLRTVGHAELQALAQATGETATLEVLVGAEALIVDEVVGHHLVSSAPSIGTRWPAHATSTGKALLAGLPDAELRLVLPRRLARATSKTIVSAEALCRELRRVRVRGYATAIGEIESGFTAVGAAVRDHEGRVIAAISIGGPSARLGSGRITVLARQVMGAAAHISRRLGYRSDEAGADAGI